MDHQQLFNETAFKHALTKFKNPALVFRKTLELGNKALINAFQSGAPIAKLIHARAWLVDQLLMRAWKLNRLRSQQRYCVIAVGGYGRRELHPYSDVDVIIVFESHADPQLEQHLKKFIAFLWDIRLEIGHSVGTVENFVENANQDITIATNLLEVRLLMGDRNLFTEFRARTGPGKLWPGELFFHGKWQEQASRYKKYSNSAYNLEPDVKQSPGGLRDIDMISWVTLHHFGTSSLQKLVDYGFLNHSEFLTLQKGKRLLWRIRFALHSLAKRREDRLLFDYQRMLATQFGYKDKPHELAIEQFMKQYYRTVKKLGELNDMLLQHFQEAILKNHEHDQIKPLNERFQICNQYIEVTNENIFQQQPSALLEIFLLMTQNPQIKGVRASTIRLIRANKNLIQKAFREKPENQAIMLKILSARNETSPQLQRMNRYGILGQYLPVFDRIIGQMQYDLFHVYTVDQHILFVVKNLRSFTQEQSQQQFPLCYEVMKKIGNIALLYIAAIFHDIGKGRRGDHSHLGAKDVKRFCQLHHLSKADTELCEWLVENHLIMSGTAQKQDIHDPDIIQQFSEKVRDQKHLDHIYLLTVADICATNPKLWNSWRDALLKHLYQATKIFFNQTSPFNRSEAINPIQKKALKLVETSGLDIDRALTLWQQFAQEYFFRYTPETIAKHTKAILNHAQQDIPLVIINQQSPLGGTEIFIFAKQTKNLFAYTTAIIDRLHLNIVNAWLSITESGHSLNSFIVLDENQQHNNDNDRILRLQELLTRQLSQSDWSFKQIKRRIPRQLRHFITATEMSFTPDVENQATWLKVSCLDRPGLLASISGAFIECQVQVIKAKISTLDEQVEDQFLLTDFQHKPVDDFNLREQLKKTIEKHLM